MKIRIASTLLALALPLVAQEPASSQVEATFYKAFYLEKGPRRFEEASALYTKFLAAAPEHKLAKEAAKQQYRLLDRLGKSEERDAFKAKFGKLIGNVAAGGTRPQRGSDAGDRPDRGEGNDRGGRGGRGGERGGRGGRRRGGIMGLMRNETKISAMSDEQLAELKTGLESAPATIERMGRFLGEEAAAKMLKSTEAMKKALDAGKTEEAQKALDGLRKSMEGVMGGRGRRGGEEGGRGGRGGRGGEEGGRGGRGGRGGEEGGRGGRGGRGGNREGGGGGGNREGGGGGGN